MKANQVIATHPPMIEASLRMSKELLETTDVLILCGGLGTRFRQVRQDIPKCLAPIRGRPFIDLLLSNLVGQGFRKIILATGYLGDQIKVHVRKRDDATYRFTRERELLGTGGALKLAEEIISSNPFLVVNGDSFVDYELTRLLESHNQSGSDISILVSSSTEGEGFGNVQLDKDERVISFREKAAHPVSSFSNAGIYCLSPVVLELIDSGIPSSLEKECFPLWIDRFKVTGVRTESKIHDIGTVDRYAAAQLEKFGSALG